MINFYVNRSDTSCIRDYLRERGAPVADRFVIHEYECHTETRRIPAAPTIFAGLDRASPAAVAAAAQIHDQLAAVGPARGLLNDPRRTLRRFDLLQRLYEAGFNRFKALRPGDDLATLRFPVFIRRENDHSGSLTPLLHDRAAIDRALWAAVLRGLPLNDLIIVEFCDTRGADGLFRKYSVMRIGDTILPRHLHISDDWMTKAETTIRGREALVREERLFQEGAAEETWLREVFDLARIEYGRIDYGIHRGEPQVWEINTNPLLQRRPGGPVDGALEVADRKLRAPGLEVVHERMHEAFRRLEDVAVARDVSIVVDPAVRERLRAEQRGGAAALRWVLSCLNRSPRAKRLVKRLVCAATAAAAPALARAYPLRLASGRDDRSRGLPRR